MFFKKGFKKEEFDFNLMVLVALENLDSTKPSMDYLSSKHSYSSRYRRICFVLRRTFTTVRL